VIVERKTYLGKEKIHGYLRYIYFVTVNQITRTTVECSSDDFNLTINITVFE